MYSPKTMAALGVLTAATVAYPFVPLSGDTWRIYYNVVAISAILIALLGVGRNSPHRRGAWLLLVGGFGGWVVADLLYTVEQNIWQLETYPNPSDAIYLGAYGLLAAGCLVMVRSRGVGRDLTALLDATIIATGAAVVAGVFLIVPLAADSELTGFGKVVSSAYPLADVLLIAVIVRMWTAPGARSTSYRLLLSALGVNLAGDMLWNIVVASDGTVADRWSDQLFLASYVLVGFAACVPSMTTLTEQVPDRVGSASAQRRLVVLAIGAMLPSVTLLIAGARGKAIPWQVIGLGALLILGLVLVRMSGILHTVEVQAVQLAALARADGLTGAPNRRTWDHELSRACAESREHNTTLCVAMMDIDHFKIYNDTHGHQTGDRLLREAVAAWTEMLGAGTLLARYGGEEFTVLLPGLTLAQAQARIQALSAVTPDAQTFSAGVSMWEPGTEPASAVAWADQALYDAKRTGRDRVLTYDASCATAPGLQPASELDLAVPPVAAASVGKPKAISHAAASWAASRLEPRNGQMSEALMVGSGEHIGSPQSSGPGLSREVRDGGSSLLAAFGDPSSVQAFMFGLGGAQGVLLIAMPHWRVDYPPILLGVAVAALVAAPLIWLSRRRLGPGSRQVVSLIGILATSLAVFSCGSEPSSISAAYFYFMIVLYAAAYFSPVAAAAQVAGVGVLYAAALALNPAAAFPGQWIQAMSFLSVTALIVGGYAFQVRGSAAALNFAAFHDTVTGLGNRALFFNQVDDALTPTGTQADQVAILYLDIDDFKTVNDSLGHPTGDQLLAALADCLGSLTRPGDTLARLGGDEFAILLQSGPMPQTAQEVANRIAATLATPFHLGDTEVTISVSIGIAVAPQSPCSCEELLREADLAMYLAKQNGKGRFETIRPGMQEDAIKHLTLMTDLRHALDNNELEVFYQPIVSVADAKPAGAEALVRWHHPQRGLLTPTEFIGAAETTDLIVTIGDWVLNQACHQAQDWRQTQTTEDAFYVSVNLSARQLAEPTITDDVARALRRSGLPPGALVLEVTETSLMLDFDAGLARLQALKDLGVRTALDDFGTGYSSLNRLRRLPIDIVKIDKSFIDEISHHSQDHALVANVVHLAHALAMTTVAEGVETPDQHHALRELGCDTIQGDLFARAQPGADTRRTLQRLAAASAPPDRNHHKPDPSTTPAPTLDTPTAQHSTLTG